MKPEHCTCLNHCYKVKVVLEKELLDSQYAEAIRKVCAKCNESYPKDRRRGDGMGS